MSNFHFSFAFLAEQDKLVQEKRAREFGLDGKPGDKENNGDSEAQASQEEACPVSPLSPDANQVHSPLYSPPSSKECGYLHCMTNISTILSLTLHLYGHNYYQFIPFEQ